MNVLFIGGNGNIGWWCAKLASELGSFNVFALTTGRTAKSRRSIPENITKWNFEVENSTVLKDFIVRHNIEVVCDFIAYDEDAVKQRHRDLRGYIKQYIFISTVSVYERKTSQLPFKESAKKWSTVEYPYATNKILAERYLEIVASKDFAVTIVRPAHTYDTIVPAPLGHNCFTVPQRLIEGKPLLIPGDGTNIWALCHSRDFASAFVRLIGNSLAFNEDFHITGEEWLTWIEIGLIMSKALGRDNIQVINVPISEIIGMKLPTSQNIKTPYFGPNFQYQRMWCDIYDNSKIKKVAPGWSCEIPFRLGIKLTFDWLMAEKSRMRFNGDLDHLLEEITEKYKNQYRPILEMPIL